MKPVHRVVIVTVIGLTICLTIVAAIMTKTPLYIKYRDVVIDIFNHGSVNSGVKIVFVRHENPDHVELYNESMDSIDLGGYKIIESGNSFEIPRGTIIPAKGSLKIYFFSRKDPANATKAEQFRREGNIVCDDFGISQGETIKLVGKDGKVRSELQAGLAPNS